MPNPTLFSSPTFPPPSSSPSVTKFQTSSPTPSINPTPLPTDQYNHLAKRHYYTACLADEVDGGDGQGEASTLSWPEEWYTQPWFTASRTLYDNQASFGPVDPPQSVWVGDEGCSALRSSLGLGAILTISQGRTGSEEAGRGVVFTSTTTGTGTGSTSTGTVILTSLLPTSSSPALIGPSPTISSSTNSTNPIPSTITCAGTPHIDYQSIGAISSALLGVVLGLVVWGVWGVLRGRRGLRGVYGGRGWFVDVANRPTTFPGFLASFALTPLFSLLTLHRHLSSPTHPPPTDSTLSLIPLLTAIKFIAISSIVALAGFLPLFLIGVPCLRETAPRSGNGRGGRVGTLTDLSVMRVLDALGPSPDSPSMETENLADGLARKGGGIVKRALASTIRPAISNARTRLIILLALTIGLIVLPSLWVILRTLNSLLGYRKRWLRDKCAGEEIWWIPFDYRLRGKMDKGERGRTIGEKEMRDLAQKHGLISDESLDSDSGKGPRIGAVYAVPETRNLQTLIARRDEVLNKLEVAEATYVRSFKANPFGNGSGGKDRNSSSTGDELEEEDVAVAKPANEESLARRLSRRVSVAHKRKSQQRPKSQPPQGGIGAPTQYVAPKSFYKLQALPEVPSTDGELDPSRTDTPEGSVAESRPTFTQQLEGRVTGTRFLEVNRDSAIFGGPLLIGSPLHVGSTGQIEPDAQSASGLGSSEHQTTSLGHEQVPERRPSPPQPVSPVRPFSPSSHTGSIRFPTPDIPDRPTTASPGPSPAAGEDPLLPTPPSIPAKPIAFQPLATGDTVRNPIPRRRTKSSFVMVPGDPEILQGHQPPIRPVSGADPLELGINYQDIRKYRPILIQLNSEIVDAQAEVYEQMAMGENIAGFILVGRNLTFKMGHRLIGPSRDAIKWNRLQRKNGSRLAFWIMTSLIILAAMILEVPFLALTVTGAPGFADRLGFLRGLGRQDGVAGGLGMVVAPALGVSLIVMAAGWLIRRLSRLAGAITHPEKQLVAFQGLAALLVIAGAIWPVLAASLLFAVEAFDTGVQTSRFVADGSVYSSWFFFCLMLNLAVLIPGLMLLMPGRLLSRLRGKNKAATPRQKFRRNYPISPDPAPLLAIILQTLTITLLFLPLFPLIAIPTLLFLLLTFFALRYLTTYVYIDLFGNSGGKMIVQAVRAMGWLVGVAPGLLGLVLLGRMEWVLGGIGVGVGVSVPILVEVFVWLRRRREGMSRELGFEHRKALAGFEEALKAYTNPKSASRPGSTVRHSKDLTSSTTTTAAGGNGEDQPLSPNVASQVEEIRDRRTSNATVLEMMAGLMRGWSRNSRDQETGGVLDGWKGLPLKGEAVDDRFETRKASKLSPDEVANRRRSEDLSHHLPPLSHQRDENTSTAALQERDQVESDFWRKTLYPPELIIPRAVVWLPDDENGIGRMEGEDLGRWHGLEGVVGGR